MKTRQLLFVLFLVKMYDANSAVTQEPVLCNGEDIPVIQQGELTCAFDVGIKPDTGADLSTSITTALAQYTYGLYFPAGEYIINNNILLHQNNNMVGSKVGITHLKSTNFDSTPQIGQPDYGYNPVASNLVIQNLILDNVIPYFYGSQTNVSVLNNAIINTVSTGSQAAVSTGRVLLSGNLLMRDEKHPGAGFSTYDNNEAIIENNFVGDIADDKIIRVFNYLKPGLFSLINKVRLLAQQGKITISSDQGNYQDAWYASSGLKNSAFIGNVIIGNTKKCVLDNPNPDGSCPTIRDHLTYIKLYNNVDVINNYYSGWPDDSSGQIKFRNASYLYFAGNYVDNKVEFDARPYDGTDEFNMDHTYIFNNNFSGGAVSYYQNFQDTPDKFIDANNFYVFNNRFDAEDREKVYVGGTAYHTHDTLYESQDTFPDGVPVKTSMFTDVSMSEVEAAFPSEKSDFLKIRVIPLWQNIGSISGPDVVENQLIRFDLTWDDGSTDFVVYEPSGSSEYKSYDWSPGLSREINEKVNHVCAGVINKNQTAFTGKRCEYMTTSASSYLNTVYTTNGKNGTFTINVVEKYNDLGSIPGGDLSENQSAVFTITFENGEKKSVTYSPPSSYDFYAYRWKKELADLINSTIDGVCAGQENLQQKSGSDKCQYVQSVGSSYLNDIYTINGQAATFTVVISTP